PVVQPPGAGRGGAGLDDQADARARRARQRPAQAGGPGAVHRHVLPAGLEPRLGGREPRRPRLDRPAQVDLGLGQHLLLPARARPGDRAFRQPHGPLRLRPPHRHRPGGRDRRDPAVARGQAGHARRALVPGRHRQCRDRPGRLEGDAAAAGPRNRGTGRWHPAASAPGHPGAGRLRRAMDAAAAAAGRAGESAPGERRGGAPGHAGHDAARRDRLAHRAGRALHDGRQDRHRTGDQPPRHGRGGSAQPAAAPAPPCPVHRLRPGRGADDRGRDRGRGRRLRRRRGRTHRAQDLRCLAAGQDARGGGRRRRPAGRGHPAASAAGRPRAGARGPVRAARDGRRWHPAGREPGPAARPPAVAAPPPASPEAGRVNVILRWLADLFVRLTRTLDWPLLAALAALMGIGLAVLHSAGGQNMSLVRSQAARYLVGLGAMWLLSRIPPLPLRRATPAVYAVSLLPLVAVLFIGTGRSGAHWINLGLFYFQPAELMKLSLPMMAAWMLSQAPLPPRMGTILATGAVIAIPTALILAQPDFGTAMLVVASGVFALYLAGMSWVWFAIAGVGAATAAGLALFAPISWFSFLRPYQQDRILTFRDPENDPLGAGWNIIQSKIAIGSGGFTGQGWGKGTQSHLNYVPEHTTDFIFAVLAEEFGWVGVATVL